jgi:hypothetical protein
MTFQLALMTIQSEMVAVFAHELAHDSGGDQAAAVNIACLTDALSRASDRTIASLNVVSHQLHEVLEHLGRVATGLRRLARLSLNGRVELATIPDAGGIGTLFTDVERQVDEARQRLAEFDTVKRTASEISAAANHPAMRVPGELHERALTFAGAGG